MFCFMVKSEGENVMEAEVGGLLDDECYRITNNACIGGNLLLLSVRSWERLPVGRPKSVKFNSWDEEDDLRHPTWAYKWDVVELQPYGANDTLGVTHEFVLNPPEWVDMDKALHRLDRRRQRKIKDSDKYHSSYVTCFHLSVEQARKSAGAQLPEHCSLAFNNYL
ncbi:hypothetical protein D1007_02824 [Hordeum vulgare]|nr:hypothetical protein D1007_02824 [Hordeum vulgare]